MFRKQRTVRLDKSQISNVVHDASRIGVKKHHAYFGFETGRRHLRLAFSVWRSECSLSAEYQDKRFVYLSQLGFRRNTVKIGCVIPSYNHAKYIAEAVRSVLDQTLPPDRVVIVDDGSTDGSVDLLRSIKDPRVEVIEQANAGAHAALTRGLHQSQDCDFISILNSDDRYHPERFNRCVRYLQENGTQLVCTRLRLIDENGKPIGQLDGRQRRINRIWANLSTTQDPIGSFGLGNFTKTTSNFFFRTGAITEFRPYRYVHDYFAALLVGFRGSLGVIHEDLIDYRVHATNTIKAEGRGPVIQEVVQMHLDLLAALRADLETNASLRKQMLRYLRIVFQNYTDMRAELLVLGIARALAGDSKAGEPFKCFPEVNEPSTPPP
jgi:glycosyltransferase involved in cell wall biosynthesis